MRKWLAIALIAVGGCSTPYQGPLRYSVGVPFAAAANVVYVRHDAKMMADGNTYAISCLAATNSNSDLLDDPIVQAANSDLSTNRWPVKRVHIDLSLDGGSTYTRRIAYGFQPVAPEAIFIWSPPEDYSLLATNAKLRLTTLDGAKFGHVGDGNPWDNPDAYIESSPFSIVGAVIMAPAAGAIYYSGFPVDVIWRQAGCGERMTLSWITPDSVSETNLVASFTNCVDGINTQQVVFSFPPAEFAKLVIRSQSNPDIIGYSETFALEP